MRVVALLGVSLLALAACSKKEEKTDGAAAPAAGAGPAVGAVVDPTTMPKRKPGLWSHSMVAEGATQTVQLCLDADTDAKMSLWGQSVSNEMCSKNVITKTADGYAFESECDIGGMGHSSGKGTVTGDFSSAYTVKMISTTTGSSIPQANKTSEMTLNAKWEGACPADMKGGDMLLPGGVKINMESMTAKK